MKIVLCFLLVSVAAAEVDPEGPETVPGEFPWTLMMLRPAPNGKMIPYCVASLIHPQMAVTSALCVSKAPGLNKTENVIVRGGEWDSSKEDDEVQEQKIKYFIRHDGFNDKAEMKMKTDDIALLLLDQPYEIGNKVKLIKVAEKDDDFVGQRCQASGWGKDQRDTKERTTMKKVSLPVLANSECRKIGIFKYNEFTFPDGTLCAGGEEKKDTCSGDAGAGLICMEKETPVLAGIVSWGFGCGVKGQPAVYTDVGKYGKWIEDKMAEMKSMYNIV